MRTLLHPPPHPTPLHSHTLPPLPLLPLPPPMRNGTCAIAQEEGSDGPEVRTINARDAKSFVKAVRRYGLVERLSDIAAEVGRSLEEASSAQRLSLWRALMGGCRTAVHMTEEAKEDAKVIGVGVGVGSGVVGV